MAQAIQTPETVSDADGVVTTFPTVWTFEEAADVRVVVQIEGAQFVQDRGVDYQLGAGDWLTNGADVVFQPGHVPPAGAKVIRQRLTPPKQLFPFGDMEAFKPQASEQAYDRLTRMIQDDRILQARALAVPSGEAGYVLPTREKRREMIPTFNGDGDLMLVPAVDVLNEIGLSFVDDGPWGAATDLR